VTEAGIVLAAEVDGQWTWLSEPLPDLVALGTLLAGEG
jgi:hypothetical protein